MREVLRLLSFWDTKIFIFLFWSMRISDERLDQLLVLQKEDLKTALLDKRFFRTATDTKRRFETR